MLLGFLLCKFGLSFAKLPSNMIFVRGEGKECSVEHPENNIMILRSREPLGIGYFVFLERLKRLESSYSRLSVSLFLSLTIVKCVCLPHMIKFV